MSTLGPKQEDPGVNVLGNDSDSMGRSSAVKRVLGRGTADRQPSLSYSGRGVTATQRASSITAYRLPVVRYVIPILYALVPLTLQYLKGVRERQFLITRTPDRGTHIERKAIHRDNKLSKWWRGGGQPQRVACSWR